MPAGPVHHEYWKRDLPVVLATSVILAVLGLFTSSYLVEFAIWYSFWYWTGRYFDPDLDLTGVTMAEGRMLRELGLLGVFLFGVTSSYAALIGWIIKTFKIKGAIGGTHRTWLTHSIVPGTLIRVAMIDILVYSMVEIIGKLLHFLLGGYLTFALGDILGFILSQICGLGTSDARHIYLDKHYGEDYGR